jgi:uncharacterized protein YndB with AHSA1/START domain
MNKALLMNFTVDKENNKIKVEREFAAPVENVWAAWTEPELMDQWWAPKPYQNKTKSMDFREGGSWLYAMVGPEGDTHWCRADYKSIKPLKSYSGLDAFCDEFGNINTEFPRTLWAVDFNANGEATLVKIEMHYEKLADLEKIIELGFKEGFTMALTNLDQYFSTHFKLR